MAADGREATAITAALNREGVLTPMLYKRAAGCSRDRWPSIHEDNYWTKSAIFKILRDERYIGKTIYGKRERDQVGHVHTVKRSRSDWVVTDDAHEEIISQDLFDRAQMRMKAYKEFVPTVSSRNPLRRKVICATCGYAMLLSKTKNAKYHCSTAHLEMGYGCTSKGVLQSDINEMVVALIRTYAAYAVDLEHLAILQKDRLQAKKRQARRELAVLQSRKSQMEKSLQDLYEKLIDGNIDREDYRTQKQQLTERMQELSSQIESLEQLSTAPLAEDNTFIAKYKQYAELETLTEDIVKEFVERVVIHPEGQIEIILSCQDELEQLLQEMNTMLSAS
jgi:hypothetical protein